MDVNIILFQLSSVWSANVTSSYSSGTLSKGNPQTNDTLIWAQQRGSKTDKLEDCHWFCWSIVYGCSAHWGNFQKKTTASRFVVHIQVFCIVTYYFISFSGKRKAQIFNLCYLQLCLLPIPLKQTSLLLRHFLTCIFILKITHFLYLTLCNPTITLPPQLHLTHIKSVCPLFSVVTSFDFYPPALGSH